MRSFVTFLSRVAAFAGSAGTPSRGCAWHADSRGLVNNTLSVSGGLADTGGFAPMIFVESTRRRRSIRPGDFARIWLFDGLADSRIRDFWDGRA